MSTEPFELYSIRRRGEQESIKLGGLLLRSLMLVVPLEPAGCISSFALTRTFCVEPGMCQAERTCTWPCSLWCLFRSPRSPVASSSVPIFTTYDVAVFWETRKRTRLLGYAFRAHCCSKGKKERMLLSTSCLRMRVVGSRSESYWYLVLSLHLLITVQCAHVHFGRYDER